MRRRLFLSVLSLCGLIATVSHSAGNPPCAKPISEAARPCPESRIVVETPPPQIIFQQAASPVQRCGHLFHRHCNQSHAIQMPSYSYAPQASYAVAPATSYAVAPATSFALAPAASFGFAPAASAFNFAPAASSFNFAPAASSFNFAPAASFGSFPVSPFSFGATPSFSMNVPFSFNANAESSRRDGDASAQSGKAEMKLDKALESIADSLKKLKDITGIHTNVLVEHDRQLKILNETFGTLDTTKEPDARLKALYEAASKKHKRE